MRFVVPAVTPVADHGGEGGRREPRPGRSGCRRGPRSTSRSGPKARLLVPARSGLRPRPAGHARREHPGPGSRSPPSARAARPRARRPRAALGRGRTPAPDRPAGRTPGRWPGPAGHGRSGGCGPGRGGAARSGCSERPRNHSSITLSDAGGNKENARSPDTPQKWVHLIASVNGRKLWSYEAITDRLGYLLNRSRSAVYMTEPAGQATIRPCRTDYGGRALTCAAPVT